MLDILRWNISEWQAYHFAMISLDDGLCLNLSKCLIQSTGFSSAFLILNCLVFLITWSNLLLPKMRDQICNVAMFGWLEVFEEREERVDNDSNGGTA